MHRINGPTDPELARFEDRAEEAMTVALQQVMDTIADRVGHVQVAAGKTLWSGCHYCLNPRHPGRCAKPGSKAYEKRHGKGKAAPGGGGDGGGGAKGADEPGAGSFEQRASKAAAGAAAEKAAPYNRDTEDHLANEPPGYDDFEGSGYPGDKVGEAVYDYGNNGYAMANGALRSTGGDVAHPPETMPSVLHYTPQRVRDMTTGLDVAMAHSKLTQDVVVHRGVSDAAKLFGSSAGNLAGLEFRDHGYVSTTTGGRVSGEFSGNRTGLQMRILAPKGTGALMSQGLDGREMLLDRGLTFKVHRDYTDQGVRTLDVEVLPK